MSRIKKILALSVLLVASILFLNKSGMQKYREQKVLMATTITLDVCFEQEQEPLLKSTYMQVWKELEEIAWRMNVYDQKSDVTRINDSSGESVQVGRDTYQLIMDSVYMSKRTHDAFDITIWPLMKLWKEHEKNNSIPTQAEINLVKSSVGSDLISLEADFKVALKNKDTKIDLGGIAKGYAIDLAAQTFRQAGFKNFFIDAGGDIYVGGYNCKGKLWRIGIKDPRNPKELISVIRGSDISVTTSGDYERYFTINNERYSHIIDPRSGFPQKEILSATVIAPSAKNADVLSTALTILDSKEGVALIDSLEGSFATLIIKKINENQVEKLESNKFKKFKVK